MKTAKHTPADFDRAGCDTLRIATTYDSCGEMVDVFAHRDAAGKIMYSAVGNRVSNFHSTPDAAVDEIDEYR